MDDPANREFIAHPKSMKDLLAIIVLFQDAADRANTSRA